MDEEGDPDQASCRSLISLLCSVPGINVLGATIILAEAGRDMSRFPTAGHLLAWAGLCPGQNESAGKHKRSRMRKGGNCSPPLIGASLPAAGALRGCRQGIGFVILRLDES